MTVWLSDEVVDWITDEGLRLHPLETGGLLLGWRHGEDRIVTGIVGSGPAALHGRYAFLPDHKWQVARIREAFSQSAGDLDYLGDWHTHPDGVALMSAMDAATLRRIARRVQQPTMVIVAGGMHEWRSAAWIYPKGRLFARGQPVGHDVRIFCRPHHWPATRL